MKKALLNFIQGNFPVDKSKLLSKGEIRRIRFVNYISLISISYIVLYIPLYLIINASLFLPAIIFLSVSSLSLLGLMFLNNSGFHLPAKILLSLLNPFFMFSVSSWLFGSKPEFHIFLFCAVIIPLFFWSIKDLKYLIVFMSLPLFLYIAIEFFPPIFEPLIKLPDNYIKYFRSTSSMATFLGAAFAVIVYFNLSGKQEKLLEKQTKELEKSQQLQNRIYSIIAHDLKSPLSGLLGLSDFLFDKSKNKVQ